jgi:hypothetical protein
MRLDDAGSGAAVMGRVLALCLAAVAFGGCGGSATEERSGSVSGPVRWDGEPLRIDGSATLPDDRIVGGRVENSSLRRIELAAGDLELETSGGKRVEAGLAFLDHYAHGVFPPTRREALATEAEQEAEDRRLGRLITIDPGESVPLTLAWRQPRGAAEPVRIRYPEGWLPLPAAGSTSGAS